MGNIDNDVKEANWANCWIILSKNILATYPTSFTVLDSIELETKCHFRHLSSDLASDYNFCINGFEVQVIDNNPYDWLFTRSSRL